jgi:ferredoxin-NADP reductase
MLFCFIDGTSVVSYMKEALVASPLFFLAFVMLTEPLTTPPTKKLQIWYGAIVGVLFAPQIHLGSVYTTPELALVIGNVFSYAVSPKQKLTLTLREKIQLTPDTYEYVFSSDKRMQFRPGQYLEWTLSHSNPDSRGNRRYFTIASSPGADAIRLGVKFYNPGSSFKNKLLAMQPGETIMAGQLSGDFTLPSEGNIVCIAGGIGVTPFMSMIRDAMLKKKPVDITMLYANRTREDIAYRDVLEMAREQLGVSTIYTLSAATAEPLGTYERSGRISAELIRNEIPDFTARRYYISGPNSMVVAFEKLLSEIGVPSSQIVVDYFPGF